MQSANYQKENRKRNNRNRIIIKIQERVKKTLASNRMGQKWELTPRVKEYDSFVM